MNHTRGSPAESDRARADRCEGGAGLQLSDAGRSRLHRRAHQCRRSGAYRQPLADRHAQRRPGECAGPCRGGDCPASVTTGGSTPCTVKATILSFTTQRLVTMVRSIRCPAIESEVLQTELPAGWSMLVLWLVWRPACMLAAQQPPVHYLHQGIMPPGAIGSRQLQRGGPLPGFFQPVEIKAPPGALISLAVERPIRAGAAGPAKGRLADRGRLSAARDEHPAGRGRGSLSHHRAHRPPLCARPISSAASPFPSTSPRRSETGRSTASSSPG